MAEEGIDSVLDCLRQRAGVTGPVNAHSFRHLFAKTALRRGGNLEAVSQMLNHHSDVAITADTYGRYERKALQDFHEKVTLLNEILDDI